MEKSLNDELSFIDENYREITYNIAEAAIKSGRSPDAAALLAVTKTVSPVYVNRVISLGAGKIGENKVQELLGKLDFIENKTVEKHIIGHLQTNKVSKIIGVVSMIQSVDSVRLAGEISKRSAAAGVNTDILIEVNIGGEEAKTGLEPSLLFETADEICSMPSIRLRGVMTVPPVCGSETQVRKYFEKTRLLYEDLRSRHIENAEIDTLSMGMSADYVPAILEGATIVRVGSKLFGARRY